MNEPIGNRDEKDFRAVLCHDCSILIPWDISEINGGRCINCAVAAYSNGIPKLQINTTPIGNTTATDFTVVKCTQECGNLIPSDIAATNNICAHCANFLRRWKGPGYCKHCLSGKKMPTIGYSRNGGAAHADWPFREYHKKCWIEMNQEL